MFARSIAKWTPSFMQQKMLAGDRRRSLTSEIADETTKKNEIEERRLQKKLQKLEDLSAKQQRRRKDEQLEYALENLSLDNRASFNSLTRSILRSGFLPPINRNDQKNNLSKSDFLLERLRGSKMIERSKEGRGPRKLTRTLSADSCPRISRFERDSKNPKAPGRNELVAHSASLKTTHNSPQGSLSDVQYGDKLEHKISEGKFLARQGSVLVSKHQPLSNETSPKGMATNGQNIQNRSRGEELSRRKSVPFKSWFRQRCRLNRQSYHPLLRLSGIGFYSYYIWL